MPFLLPELAKVGEYYDGRKPLPRRAEKVVRLAASDALTLAQLAKRTGISERSISRLRAHAAYQSRLIYLRERAAERALAEEPLALKGNRIAMAGQMARTLRDQLEANGYTTVLGVSKQGNPIVGFDRARVSEIRQYLSTIADELQEPASKQAADTLAVQVTMTTEQAVTKVQALLSRAQPAEEGTPLTPMPRGVEGGMNGNVTMDKDSDGSPQAIDQNSDAKEILDAEYTEE